MGTGQTKQTTKRGRGRLQEKNRLLSHLAIDLLHLCTQNTFKSMPAKHGLGLNPVRPFHKSARTETTLLSCIFTHPPLKEWQSDVLSTTCKPHPTEEAFQSCPPCPLLSHRGPVTTTSPVESSTSHLCTTRGISVTTRPRFIILCGFTLSPKIDLGICLL